MDDPPRDRPLTGTERLIPSALDATIVFVRHGESTAIVEGRFQGRLETPLSELGWRQAALAGTRLARPAAPPRIPVPARAPVEIVHSPLARTRQTADAVAQAMRDAHGPDATPAPRPEPDLVELGQGEWEGLHRDEVMSRYPDELEAWRRRPTAAQAPGGERVIDADARARRALTAVIDRLVAEGPAGRVGQTNAGGYPATHGPRTPWTLLVGHDGIFKVALLALLELPLERFWTFPWGLTGISVVELVDGRAVLRAHDLTDHLAPLQIAESADEARSETEAEERQRTGSL